MIYDTIPEICGYLQLNYSQVPIKEMSDKEDKLYNALYDPILSVNIVFRAVNKFRDLCSSITE